MHQGDPGDALHVVASGAVKIVLPSTEGEEAIIATLRPGDFFGELALLDGAPRSATVTSLEQSEMLVLPRAVFMDLLDNLPGLRDALLTGLARELRRLTGDDGDAVVVVPVHQGVAHPPDPNECGPRRLPAASCAEAAAPATT